MLLGVAHVIVLTTHGICTSSSGVDLQAHLDQRRLYDKMKLKATLVLIALVSTLCVIFLTTSNSPQPDSPVSILSRKKRDSDVSTATGSGTTTADTDPDCVAQIRKIKKDFRKLCRAVLKNKCDEDHENERCEEMCEAYRDEYPPTGGGGGDGGGSSGGGGGNPDIDCSAETMLICFHIGKGCYNTALMTTNERAIYDMMEAKCHEDE